MATITLNVDALPADAKSAKFSFGNTSFELDSDSKFETTEPGVIGDAAQHPWLKVEVETVEEPAAAAYDPTDPHQNPSADHLSGVASEETLAAAAANEKAIREAADGVTSAAPVESGDPVQSVPNADAAKPSPEVQASFTSPTLGETA